MPGHADILDRPEPLLQSFWGSVLLHGLAIGGLLLAGAIGRVTRLNMGDPNGGGLGSVMVNPVRCRIAGAWRARWRTIRSRWCRKRRR